MMKSFLPYFTLLFILSLGFSGHADLKAQILIVGSLHDLHKSLSFTEDKFEKILTLVNPDLVLLEFPVDWFGPDNLPDSDLKGYLEDETHKDGIRDGQLAWKYCQSHHVPCLPFDIKGRNQFFKEHNVFPRLEIFNREIRKYAALDPVAEMGILKLDGLHGQCHESEPAILNGPLCDEIFSSRDQYLYSLYLKARSENKIQDPDFYQLEEDFSLLRNQTMANQICSAAQSRPGQKILVVTGVDHHYILTQLLSQCSFGEVRPWWL